MHEIMRFEFAGTLYDARHTDDTGEPWFTADRVADMLGLRSHIEVIRLFNRHKGEFHVEAFPDALAALIAKKSGGAS